MELGIAIALVCAAILAGNAFDLCRQPVVALRDQRDELVDLLWRLCRCFDFNPALDAL